MKLGIITKGSIRKGTLRKGIIDIGGGFPEGALQILYSNDGLNVLDEVGTLALPDVVEVPCLEFDGIITTKLETVPFSVEFSSNDFEVSCWVKTTSTSRQSFITKSSSGIRGFDLRQETGGAVQFRATDSVGSLGTSIKTGTGVLAINTWSHIVARRIDGVDEILVNGIVKAHTGTLPAIIVTSTAKIVLGNFDSSSLFSGKIANINIKINDESLFHMIAQEGGGLPYDVSGNGNHAILNTATWDTVDGIRDYLSENGFYVETQGVAPYIPALADGSAAANGLALTNLGGAVHNRAPSGWIQTDADEAVFGGSNLFGDGTTWVKTLIANLDAHVNGTDNVWIQWRKEGSGNVCHAVKIATFHKDKVFTLAEYNQLVSWAGDPTCGDGVVDFSVTGFSDGFDSGFGY